MQVKIFVKGKAVLVLKNLYWCLIALSVLLRDKHLQGICTLSKCMAVTTLNQHQHQTQNSKETLLSACNFRSVEKLRKIRVCQKETFRLVQVFDSKSQST